MFDLFWNKSTYEDFVCPLSFNDIYLVNCHLLLSKMEKECVKEWNFKIAKLQFFFKDINALKQTVDLRLITSKSNKNSNLTFKLFCPFPQKK